MQVVVQSDRVGGFSFGGVAAVVATILALVSALYVVFGPGYTRVSTYTDTTGLTHETSIQSSFIEVNGRRALIPVFFPMVICAVGVAVGSRLVRAAAAVVLCGFVVIAGFSIGTLYAPSALAMVVAAAGRP